MSKVDVIRAWKDEAYRVSLSPAQRAALPANPAGAIELADAQLEHVAAGLSKTTVGYTSACGGNSAGGNCNRLA